VRYNRHVATPTGVLGKSGQRHHPAPSPGNIAAAFWRLFYFLQFLLTRVIPARVIVKRACSPWSTNGIPMAVRSPLVNKMPISFSMSFPPASGQPLRSRTSRRCNRDGVFRDNPVTADLFSARNASGFTQAPHPARVNAQLLRVLLGRQNVHHDHLFGLTDIVTDGARLVVGWSRPHRRGVS